MVGFSFLLHTAENRQSAPFVMEIDLPIGARLLHTELGCCIDLFLETS